MSASDLPARCRRPQRLAVLEHRSHQGSDIEVRIKPQRFDDRDHRQRTQPPVDERSHFRNTALDEGVFEVFVQVAQDAESASCGGERPAYRSRRRHHQARNPTDARTPGITSIACVIRIC